jgi:S-adenosylmethionine decarboxylase
MENNTDIINFGEHITLDGYMGDKTLLNNKEAILAWLNDLPEALGMHKISEPQVVYSEGNGDKDPGGFSGVVMIAESHISVHTFVDRCFASADVYTCKNGMDTEKIIQFFKETFGFEDVETHFIKRGTRYPSKDI